MADTTLIRITCPNCQKTLRVKQELAGKKGRCPGCHRPFIIQPDSAPSVSEGKGPTNTLQQVAHPGKTPKPNEIRSSRQSPEPPVPSGEGQSNALKAGIATCCLALMAILGYVFLFNGNQPPLQQVENYTEESPEESAPDPTKDSEIKSAAPSPPSSETTATQPDPPTHSETEIQNDSQIMGNRIPEELPGKLLGVFTEDPRSTEKIELVSGRTPQDQLGKRGSLYLWQNLISIHGKPFEGKTAWHFRAAANRWFGLGVFLGTPRDLTSFKQGTLKFHVKTTSSADFKVGIESPLGGKSWVVLGNENADYGFARDGQWHLIQIPMSQFEKTDLTKVQQPFMFSAGPPSATTDFSIDNVCWTVGQLPPDDTSMAANLPGNASKQPTKSGSSPQRSNSEETKVLDTLKKLGIPARKDVAQEILLARKKLTSRNRGYVVVGQVELPDNCKIEDLVCQADILPGGYFVDAISTPGIPIWFWHPKCRLAEAVPQSRAKPFEWLGKIQLARDVKRATLTGLTRANHYELPKKVAVDAEYVLSFLNTVDRPQEKKDQLEQKLASMAPPKISIQRNTGVFEIKNVLDAPLRIKISSEGVESYQEVVFPVLDQATDLGVCDLSAKRNNGPLPGLENVKPASDGESKLKRVLKQLKQESGTSANSKRFHDRLNELIFGSASPYRRNTGIVETSKSWIKQHGARSAVAVFTLVHVPNVDMTQLTSHLFIEPAIYVPSGSNYSINSKKAPQLVFGIAKPGSTIHMSLPGFAPFEYQVRGSQDGIEVISEVKLKPLNQRTFGSIELERPQEQIAQHLQFDAKRHLTQSGEKWSQPRKITIGSNGSFSPPGLKGLLTSKGVSFQSLPPGPFSLTLSANEDFWPRQIGFQLNPRQKLRIPSFPLYKILEADVKSAVDLKSQKDRSQWVSFSKSKIKTENVTPNEFNMPVQFKSGTSGRSYYGAGGMFNRQGGLRWTATQKGNTLAYTPIHYDQNGRGPRSILHSQNTPWSIMRLGTGELNSYKNLEVNTKNGFPGLSNKAYFPLRLSSGNSYLLHKAGEYGHSVSILVRVQ